MEEQEVRDLKKALRKTARPAIPLVGDPKKRPQWSWHTLVTFVSTMDNRPKPGSLHRYDIVIVTDDVGMLMEEAVRDAASPGACSLSQVSLDEVGNILDPFCAKWSKGHEPARPALVVAKKKPLVSDLDDDDDEDDPPEDEESDEGPAAEELLGKLDVPVEDDGEEPSAADDDDDEPQHPARPEEDDVIPEQVLVKLRRALDLVDPESRSKQVAVFGLFEDSPLSGYHFLEPLDVSNTPVTPGNKLMKRISVAIVLTECAHLPSQHVQDDIKACIKNGGGIEWVQGVSREHLLAALAAVFGAPNYDDESEQEQLVAAGSKPRDPLMEALAPVSASTAVRATSDRRPPPSREKGAPVGRLTQFVDREARKLPRGQSIAECEKELYERAQAQKVPCTINSVKTEFFRFRNRNPNLDLGLVHKAPEPGKILKIVLAEKAALAGMTRKQAIDHILRKVAEAGETTTKGSVEQRIYASVKAGQISLLSAETGVSTAAGKESKPVAAAVAGNGRAHKRGRRGENEDFFAREVSRLPAGLDPLEWGKRLHVLPEASATPYPVFYLRLKRWRRSNPNIVPAGQPAVDPSGNGHDPVAAAPKAPAPARAAEESVPAPAPRNQSAPVTPTPAPLEVTDTTATVLVEKALLDRVRALEADLARRQAFEDASPWVAAAREAWEKTQKESKK